MAPAKAYLALGSPAVLLASIGLTVLLVLPAAAPAAAEPPAETGVWLDENGSGAVELYPCADRADRLCGRIVWLKEPLNAQGVPKRDRHNPNESLQKRPICGLPVLGNLARVPEGGFDGGWIYDPRAGKSYSAAVQRIKGDRLIVTGYVGLKFLSKSFTWSRAPANLQRCGSAPPSAQEARATLPATVPPAAKTAIPPQVNLQKEAAAEPPRATTPPPPALKPSTTETLVVPRPVAAKPPAAKTNPPAAEAAAVPSVPLPQKKSADPAAKPPGGTGTTEAAKAAAAPGPKATTSAPTAKTAKQPADGASPMVRPSEVTGFSWE